MHLVGLEADIVQEDQVEDTDLGDQVEDTVLGDQEADIDPEEATSNL